MIENKKSYSLITITSTIVIITVTLLMGLLLTYNYTSTKAQLVSEFENSSQEISNRLKISLEHFISSYSINEYNKLLTIEMSNKNIKTIILEDYLTGKILSQDSYTTAKTRDKNWKIIDLDLENKVMNSCYLEKTSIISSDGNKIGKITFYFTDKFLNEKLNSLIVKSIFAVFTVAFLLIVFLFFTLNRFVLSPVNKLIDSLLKKDALNLPKPLNINEGTKEIIQLSHVIDEMIKRIKISKEKINKLNERFELTLDAVNDGIWDWDPVSNRAYFSKRWSGMLGYDESEIKSRGSEFFRLLHDDDKQKAKEALDKHFKDPVKNPYNIEVRLKCKDGSYKWILSRGKALLDENNKPFRMLGYHSDITHEKENEEHLKQQESIINQQSKLASMGEMIGNIAHQWRQPLSVISTAASGIKIKNEYNSLDTEFLNETCDAIVYQTQFLSKTIDDFRNFIKGDSKAVRFNLEKDIQSFLKVVESSIKKYNIKVVQNIEKDLEIVSYPNELIQCFINLFNNSKDALLDNKTCDDERFVFIDVKKEKGKVFITFKDNAGGMSQKVLLKVFEPYFTTKHQSKGTGLGLHMTYNLITKGMKGSISVQNDTFDYNNKQYKGAKFTIELRSLD